MRIVDSIIWLRLAVTLTFLILAAGGPYAIFLLRKFIKLYIERQKALELRVEILEQHLSLKSGPLAHPSTTQHEAIEREMSPKSERQDSPP